MFNSLKNFFKQTEVTLDKSEYNDLQLLCGLMIEAANVDDQIDQVEIDKISEALIKVFKEDPDLVEIELQKCVDEAADNKSLHFFTSKINKSFQSDKKILLLQILWEIILEDGKIHDFESNLIRRLAGLLYITDQECGNAKKIALEKLKLIN